MLHRQRGVALSAAHPVDPINGFHAARSYPSEASGLRSTASRNYLVTVLRAIVLAASVAACTVSVAQCPAGSSAASVNWDNLDYLKTTGSYAGYVTTGMRDSQRFAIGVNRVRIDVSSISTNGENTQNTAEAGSYGSGADVRYSGNGTIVFTFDTVVRDLQFSLYDIDWSQSVQVTAMDDALVALNITMSAVTPGIITVTGSGGTAPVANASNSGASNSNTQGTLNISIAGNSPASATGVNTVTINMGYGGGSSGVFWMSDLNACVFGSFPNNYYVSQQPFTGQPSYYLVTPDNNSVYVLNPATGVADWLFTEPGSPWVNSMAYDPINRVVYYVKDFPSPQAGNGELKRYDVTTGTISTAVPDITTLGIPLFSYEIESAAAAFYNGSLFIGIEGANFSRNSSRESIIWRIDFDASLNAVAACQVFASPADNGSGTLLHDWADFTIKDGLLYDFNSGNQSTTTQFIHFNMQDGSAVTYSPGTNPVPVQVGQTWDGKVYWTGGQVPETGRVALYNEDGTIGAKTVVTVTACSPAWVARAGDASDPFKPMSDFGDTPETYDPASGDPATHEYDCNLILGSTFDREWAKDTSFDATADGADEDGIGTVSILYSGSNIDFDQDVDVYNNTGSDATLVGWLDYNGDGVFTAGEGISATVPTSASTQTITLSWTGLTVPIAAGGKTFIRVRLTSASNGMTTSSINGWFANGEVEDYRVSVDGLQPIELISFDAQLTGDLDVRLDWLTAIEINFLGFEIQRSTDAQDWDAISFVPGSGETAGAAYSFIDDEPLFGKSYYRLKSIDRDESFSYSNVESVELLSTASELSLFPNPASTSATLQFFLSQDEEVTVRIVGYRLELLREYALSGLTGENVFNLGELDELPRGVCLIQVVSSAGISTASAVLQ